MKIKVDAEKLIAKYLLGDLTDPEKEQLDNWIKSSPQHEEFFNRLCTNMSFRKRYEAYTQINSHQAWKHFKKKYCQASITSIFLILLIAVLVAPEFPILCFMFLSLVPKSHPALCSNSEYSWVFNV